MLIIIKAAKCLSVLMMDIFLASLLKSSRNGQTCKNIWFNDLSFPLQGAAPLLNSDMIDSFYLHLYLFITSSQHAA